jgi:hypothetical protein
VEAIRGLSAADLDAFPVPGTWSIRQIVVHLMDSDLVASDRMKRVIAMERPALLAYDQDAFVKHLDYSSVDAELAARVFALNRELTAGILRRLPDSAFARLGDHNENGPMSLERLVNVYVEHLEHHMKFLRRKRELLGKPLS